MTNILLFTYSPYKNEYFYLHQKVKDTRLNKIGNIVKIKKLLNSSYIIYVKFKNKTIGYDIKSQIYLDLVKD